MESATQQAVTDAKIQAPGSVQEAVGGAKEAGVNAVEKVLAGARIFELSIVSAGSLAACADTPIWSRQ